MTISISLSLALTLLSIPVPLPLSVAVSLSLSLSRSLSLSYSFCDAIIPTTPVLAFCSSTPQADIHSLATVVMHSFQNPGLATVPADFLLTMLLYPLNLRWHVEESRGITSSLFDEAIDGEPVSLKELVRIPESAAAKIAVAKTLET